MTCDLCLALCEIGWQASEALVDSTTAESAGDEGSLSAVASRVVTDVEGVVRGERIVQP